MARGGARVGSGRPRKTFASLKLAGTLRADRHQDRIGSAAGQAAAVVLPMPEPARTDWRPTLADVAMLAPRAGALLQATLEHFAFSPVEGRLLLESMNALSRSERLETEAGTAALAAATSERRLFLSIWQQLNLRLEK
jgi:hypothetical protein